MPPVHDVYMDSISRTVDDDESYALFYLSNPTNLYGGKQSPYDYYLLNPLEDGKRIKAVGKKGERTHVYDIKWNVVYYEFDASTDLSIGKGIMKWARGELNESEQIKLQENVQWRGLYTNSSYKDYALHDILGTIAVFYSDESLKKEIEYFILSEPLENGQHSNYDDDLQRIVMASLMGKYNEFPLPLQNDIRFLAKVYRSDAHDDSKDTYFSVRNWLEQTSPEEKSMIEYLEEFREMMKAGKSSHKTPHANDDSDIETLEDVFRQLDEAAQNNKPNKNMEPIPTTPVE